MSISKVIYGSNTLIDLTSDTVKAEDIAEGVTAHDASGESIVGTMLPSVNIFALEGDDDSNLYAIYTTGTAEPEFEVDAEGNLYYIGPAESFEVDSENNIYLVIGGTE